MTLLSPYINSEPDPVDEFIVRMSFIDCEDGLHSHLDLQSKPLIYEKIHAWISEQVVRNVENGSYKLNAFVVLKHVERNPYADLLGGMMGGGGSQMTKNQYNPGGYH